MRVLLILTCAALVAQAQTPAPQTAKPNPAVTAPPAAPSAAQPAPVAQPRPPAEPPLSPEDEKKVVYAVGLVVGRQLAQLDLSPDEMDIVRQAIADSRAGKPALELTEWGPKIRQLAQARAGNVVAREKALSKAYLEKAAAEPGAVKTDSGIVYRELTPGTGESPKLTDTVKVNYRGTLVNGTEFDSSYRRNQPAVFGVRGVIPCWTEGIQKMKAGGKSILVCPSDLAYRDAGNAAIPGGAALIFEVELLEIMPPPPAPPAPPQPAAPAAAPAPPAPPAPKQ